jgi:hypothetical protein
MGVLSTNRTQIVAGGLISASYVGDIYNVLTGNTIDAVSISGSLNVTGSIVGNLTGTATTASYSFNAISSSYATTSSYLSGTTVNAVSSSIQYVNVTSKFITQGTVFMYTASLPTTDPVNNGQIWRSGSFVMISTGSGI